MQFRNTLLLINGVKMARPLYEMLIFFKALDIAIDICMDMDMLAKTHSEPSGILSIFSI